MNAPVKNESWKLDPTKEAIAAKSLRESLIASYGEDDELLLNAVEGETNLLEIIDKLIVRRSESLGLAAGLDGVLSDLEERKRRFIRRAEVDKTLIEQALTVVGIPKLERPGATLSMALRAPTLIVTEESQIPITYWKTGAPTLDKKALTEALRARSAAIASLPTDEEERKAALAAIPEIPGATLSNGSQSLTIRVK